MSDAEKVFVDANIFLDYYFDRKDSIKPLGEFAFQFFKKTLRCKYTIVLCSEIFDELLSVLQINSDDLDNLIFCEFKKYKKLELIEPTKEQVAEARHLSHSRNTPLNDALFSVIARDQKICLISRDNHHLYNLSDIAKTFKPEDLQ